MQKNIMRFKFMNTEIPDSRWFE